jgi:hypothetical protein
MNIEAESENYQFTATEFEKLLYELDRIEKESDLYWIDLE